MGERKTLFSLDNVEIALLLCCMKCWELAESKVKSQSAMCNGYGEERRVSILSPHLYYTKLQPYLHLRAREQAWNADLWLVRVQAVRPTACWPDRRPQCQCVTQPLSSLLPVEEDLKEAPQEHQGRELEKNFFSKKCWEWDKKRLCWLTFCSIIEELQMATISNFLVAP